MRKPINLKYLAEAFRFTGADVIFINERNLLINGIVTTVDGLCIYGFDKKGKVFSVSYISYSIDSLLSGFQYLIFKGVFGFNLNTWGIKASYQKQIFKAEQAKQN